MKSKLNLMLLPLSFDFFPVTSHLFCIGVFLLCQEYLAAWFCFSKAFFDFHAGLTQRRILGHL